MAITETKIVQVENLPGVINASNEEWGKFGWSVLNVQITHSQDTKTYTRGLDYYTGDKTVETTTINYATITYQRDKSMPNYRKIVELEQEYIQTGDEISRLYSVQHDRPKTMSKLVLILLVIFFWPAAIVYVIYCNTKKGQIDKQEASEEFKQLAQERDSKMAALTQRRYAIVAEAAELMEIN